MLKDDPAWAARAARVAAAAKDVSEILERLDFPATTQAEPLRLAYHSACSMQHGQRLKTGPKALLEQAGFAVMDVPEGHICCGSAGTYSLLQPDLSQQLRDRKLGNIALTKPQAVATGNIGCLTQLQAGLPVPIVHTVELLDWAYGGPKPAGL
jgi:glycolate oxidase iron-sulfur subunit